MLNESRNNSMRSNMKRYCSCREETDQGHIPVGLQISMLKLTTESTLPGFWMRSAFTTWNTSTMPSVLQHSVALIREQNTPHRLTVSLHTVQVCGVCVCMCVCVHVCAYWYHYTSVCVCVKREVNGSHSTLIFSEKTTPMNRDWLW